MKKYIKRGFLLIAMSVNCLLLSSCSEQIWMGVAEGLAGMTSYPSSYIPTYSSYNTSSSYSSSSYSSSSYGSSSSKCPRCKGTGNCQTCSGTGEVYDWGPGSISSKSKYQHRCGVCSVKGKCNVCGGDGQV